jgi:hypothetical protein
MPKKELPAVALFRQEKLPFFIPGFHFNLGYAIPNPKNFLFS